jgi:hypothetical protein
VFGITVENVAAVPTTHRQTITDHTDVSVLSNTRTELPAGVRAVFGALGGHD